jgi:hypothetical protein
MSRVRGSGGPPAVRAVLTTLANSPLLVRRLQTLGQLRADEPPTQAEINVRAAVAVTMELFRWLLRGQAIGPRASERQVSAEGYSSANWRFLSAERA